MLDVDAIRRDFPILEREFQGKPLVYLDSAATSQKPVAVIEAEAEFYRHHNANAHRGIYTLGRGGDGGVRRRARADRAVLRRRRSRAARLHARHHRVDQPRRARLGTHLPPRGRRDPAHRDGAPLEHRARGSSSRRRPARRSGTSASPTTDSSTCRTSEQLLTERTKILAVTAMSNALGTIPPLRQLIDAAHAVDAIVGRGRGPGGAALALDVDALDADFLAFSGHKMLGPDGERRSARQARASRSDAADVRRAAT